MILSSLRNLRLRLSVRLFLLMTLFAHASFARADVDVRDAMVKIYSVQTEPYYYDPWSMNRPTSTSGSGCIISERRILTNAHVVSDQSFLQVRRHGEPIKYTARVLTVSHTADLALLTVDEPAFFSGAEPLPIGGLPEIQQEVLVYGFPEGGDTLSITKGVVSRIEHDTYAHSAHSLLAVQIDAAINSGNSGGPVVIDQRISGVVMQYLQESENIGYMVPAPIIQHFLTDLKDGRYDGIPEDGILMQPMENASLRQRYGLNSQQSGVLVTAVLPGSSADGHVRPGDVIVAVDGHRIASDGTVEFRPRERTSANYYTQLHQIGDTLRLSVLRKGKELTIPIPLTQAIGANDLIPRVRYDIRPTYFIYGGLLFVPLTQNYLMAWGDDWYETAPKSLVALYRDGRATFPNEEIVVLSKVLPAEVNSGYHDYHDFRIVSVNGKKVKNLKDLVEKVDQGKHSPFVEFQSAQGIQITLDRKKVKAAEKRIFEVYSVPADRSEDLR